MRRRFKHNLSHDHLFSCDMGQLIPFTCMEVLPGQSSDVQTSLMIRVTPQIKPVMHKVTVNTAFYYVPNRLLWSGWEDFITGKEPDPPPTLAGYAHESGKLSDYLGVFNDASNTRLAFPQRAYNMIWNENFRDQDLQSEVWEDSNLIQNVCWEKDYFTAARPWPQRGDAVTLPVGSRAPVRGLGMLTTTNWNGGASVNVKESGGVNTSYVNPDSSDSELYVKQDGATGYPDIYADLSDANAIDIRAFREAFGLQRHKEAMARYGGNYADMLRYLGVRPSDARLQKPEYLGGGRAVLQFSEVLNTAMAGGTDPLGELGGHGIAAMRGNRFRRFFEEHGWVIGVMWVRPKTLYMNGLHRKFTRTVKEDYFHHELENIGAQEVRNKEVYAGHSSPDGIFGYNPKYSEYRSEPSRVSAEFRTSVGYDWHFGRQFTSDIALNDAFVKCAPTKRVFAEQTQHSLWVMTHNKVIARSPVSKRQVGSMQ